MAKAELFPSHANNYAEMQQGQIIRGFMPAQHNIQVLLLICCTSLVPSYIPSWPTANLGRKDTR